jgi:hypothetical protein
MNSERAERKSVRFWVRGRERFCVSGRARADGGWRVVAFGGGCEGGGGAVLTVMVCR